MDFREYDGFKHRAVHDLMALNKDCEDKFGPGRWERYNYDLDAGTLTFLQGGKPKVIAEIQAVGSTSPRSGTWLWSWANDSLLRSAATRHMSKVRQFGIDNAIAELTGASLRDDGHLGWALTAVSAALLKGKGGYRCPRGGGGYLYLLYTDIAFADFPAPKEQRAREQDQIECDRHGSGEATYICEHIFSNPRQQWFSDNPSPANPWPDAWCVKCDEHYQKQGEWNDKNSADVKIRQICHRCYGEIQALRTGTTFREDS